MNYKCVYNDNIRILSVNAKKQQTQQITLRKIEQEIDHKPKNL